MVRYIISMAYYSDGDSTLYTEIDDDIYPDFCSAKAAMDSLARIQADNLSVEFVQWGLRCFAAALALLF